MPKTQENKHIEDAVEIRSREFREILNKPPHALVLYGTTVICLVIALLIAGSIFFKYPVITDGKAIVSQHAGFFTAKVYIPVAVSGKIKAGQPVNIKTDAYPFMEYGLIQGKVKTLTSDLNTGKMVIDVDFPRNRQTGIRFSIPEGTFLTGKGEIIIENKRILEKILPFTKIFFKKNE